MNKSKNNPSLANALGYEFKNKDLLSRALTHSSFSKENYERLEFLGDGILDFIVGDYLFRQSQQDEGQLTVLRSHFVSENNLCKIFDSLQIEKFVITGKSYQGSLSKAIKADIVEAIIAAIYLDGENEGLKNATKFVKNHFALETFSNIVDDNYKSRLQELVQAGFKCKMQYVTEKTDFGFKSTFFMDEDAIESGEGQSKIEAEQQAAKKSIQKLFKV